MDYYINVYHDFDSENIMNCGHQFNTKWEDVNRSLDLSQQLRKFYNNNVVKRAYLNRTCHICVY